MYILGIYHSHDACAALYEDYRLVAAVAQERATRVKGDGGRFPAEAVEECLAQGGLRPRDVDVVVLPRVNYPVSFYRLRAHVPFPKRAKGGQLELIRVMSRNRVANPVHGFDAARWLAGHGLSPRRIAFYNHHLAHALGALFHTDWNDALLYTSDGGGDRVFYSARRLTDGRLEDLFGGESDSVGVRHRQDKADSLGNMYYFVTEALGMKPLRHEGKVLGLAAFGRPTHADRLRRFYVVERDGQIRARADMRAIAAAIRALASAIPREDMAASAQKVLEDVTLEALERIVERAPARALGLSGGVFANVKLTQRIAERFPFEEIFVYPAMSDQGEAAGGVLQFLLERDGLTEWLSRRRRFANLYFGLDHGSRADALFRQDAICVSQGDVAATAAQLIADGKIVGTYLGRGEYGPRALGARSIMASPRDRGINDWLNKRLERTDFMPFAPVVREERYSEAFDLPTSLRYTAGFMTVTCNVRPEWRERIPAVVHVDGTARPQILRREENPTYYEILKAFEEKSGLPAAINTSFNVHEEPIINRPEEALKALTQDRVDFLVTDAAVYRKS
jgi:carbamoyltransferase